MRYIVICICRAQNVARAKGGALVKVIMELSKDENNSKALLMCNRKELATIQARRTLPNAFSCKSLNYLLLPNAFVAVKDQPRPNAFDAFKDQKQQTSKQKTQLTANQD